MLCQKPAAILGPGVQAITDVDDKRFGCNAFFVVLVTGWHSVGPIHHLEDGLKDIGIQPSAGGIGGGELGQFNRKNRIRREPVFRVVGIAASGQIEHRRAVRRHKRLGPCKGWVAKAVRLQGRAFGLSCQIIVETGIDSRFANPCRLVDRRVDVLIGQDAPERDAGLFWHVQTFQRHGPEPFDARLRLRGPEAGVEKPDCVVDHGGQNLG